MRSVCSSILEARGLAIPVDPLKGLRDERRQWFLIVDLGKPNQIEPGPTGRGFQQFPGCDLSNGNETQCGQDRVRRAGIETARLQDNRLRAGQTLAGKGGRFVDRRRNEISGRYEIYVCAISISVTEA
jgi:hypothetical protein